MKALVLTYETVSYCLGVAGSIAFAYGLVAKKIEDILREIEGGFLFTDYFKYKNAVFSLCQTIVGIIILAIALFFTLKGYENPGFPILDYPFCPFWGRIFYYILPYLIIVACLIIFISIANCIAYKISFPVLKDRMRNEYKKHRENFWSNIDQSPNIKEITHAKEFIENMEMLFGLSSRGSLKDRMFRVEKVFNEKD